MHFLKSLQIFKFVTIKIHKYLLLLFFILNVAFIPKWLRIEIYTIITMFRIEIYTIITMFRIEIIIKDEQLNVTPTFYTYDASKIKEKTYFQNVSTILFSFSFFFL